MRQRPKKDNQLQSMTGFGKGLVTAKNLRIEIEIKSYNSRFLECGFKLPRAYAPLEASLRSQIGQSVTRGRVEVSINRYQQSAQAYNLIFNHGLYQAFVDIYHKLNKRAGKSTESAESELILELLKRKDILEIQEREEVDKKEQALLQSCLSKALLSFSEMRSKEGQATGREIQGSIDKLHKFRERLLILSHGQAEQNLSRLKDRIAKLTVDVKLDEARLYSEAMLLVDRQDVTEELARLESHLEQAASALNSPPAGRKLDFLTQELQREFNTIASKCQNAEMQALVVDAKVELERIKEQLANIE